MASSVNKIQILGYVGRDPDVRSTQSGKTVTTLTVATSEVFGSGENKKEKTEWHRVIVWDKLGDVAGNYLKKGRRVFIEGKVTYREYEDHNKIKRFMTEIIASNLVFLGGKDENKDAGSAEGAGNYPHYPADNNLTNGDDEVPF